MNLSRPLSNFAFFVYPFVLIGTIALAEIFLTLPEKKYFYSEFGVVEISHEIGLFISLVFSFWLLSKIKKTENKWLKIWIWLAALGCLYSLGEEISWGQTFFQWQTPEEWAAINGQGETNLHNSSHLLNQLPKAILEIGVLTGGLIIPALKKWKPSALPEKFASIYADGRVCVIAFLALIVKILELVPGELGVEIFWRKSEVIETVMFHFVLVYLISIAQKWRLEGRLNP